MVQPTIVPQSVFSEIPIPRSSPANGKRAFVCPLDFSKSPSGFMWNLLIQQWQDVMSAVTCVYIDNTDNDKIFELFINITSQRIVAQPRTQGYYAVIVPSTFQFKALSPSSTAIVPFYILNYTPSNSVWGPSTETPPGTTDVNIVSSITLPVSVQNFPAQQHVIIDSGIANPLPVSVGNFPAIQPVSGAVSVSNFPATQDQNLIKLAGTAIDVNSGNSSAGTQRIVLATDQPLQTNVCEQVTTSADVIRRRFVANLHQSTLFSLTNAFHTFLTGSPKYFLANVNIQLDPTMTFAGGGSVVVILSDTTDGTIFQWFMYLPNAATVPAVASNFVLNTPPDFFYKATTSTSSLQLKVNVNPVGSNFCINLAYGLTSL